MNTEFSKLYAEEGEKWTARQGARMLRLAVVKNVFGQGLISESEAEELLSGCLSPGDESTRIDDSALLNVTFEQAVEATRGPVP